MLGTPNTELRMLYGDDIIDMRRVMIIGSNGAGKSTFSFRLAKVTRLPLVHIDKIYWRGCWEVTPRDEFVRIMEEKVQGEEWIIEGNNLSTIGQRLQYADTVFWFEFPPLLCVLNVIKRELKHHKRVRPDMPDECVSRIDLPWLKTVWQFNKKNRDRIRQALEKAENVEVIRFMNYGQVRKYFSRNVGRL